MSFFKNDRLAALGAVLILISLILWAYHALKPVPVNTDFITSEFSFTYPRSFDNDEYSPGVVSLGHNLNGELVPLIDVDLYKSDPESTLPKSFAAFVKQQTEAVCGSDNSIEAISCTQASSTSYTSPKGVSGQKLELKMTRRNLKTGTTTSEMYGPFYVFDITPTGPREADIPFRYEGLFVYPSFSAFLQGTTTPELLTQVINTLQIPKK
jgi:hypothetical protein